MSQQLKTKKPKLKICGVTIASDVSDCCNLGVDYVGFNLFVGSKRYITAAKARQIWLNATQQLPTQTKPAVVIVDHTPEQLAAALRAFPEIQVIQVHNVSAASHLEPLRKVVGDRQLWAGIAVHHGQDLRVAADCQLIADLILLDSAAIPSDSRVAGGSGQAFDWELLANLDQSSNFGIAGGITQANLPELAKFYTPRLIDVCSGVERSPGQKDPGQIKALIKMMRSLW